MLQIILSLFIILSSADSFAQGYQAGQVPAFLQNEAAQQQYQQQQTQHNGSVPAFLQQEQQQEQLLYQQQMQQLQQQNQYNYQSADPNSASFTLPPAVYQPAPGETPAFILQQQNPDQAQSQQEDATLKTNKKEDTIQINFSDEQYKDEEEVTPLNKEQATQYNTEIKQNDENSSANSEIPEGAKFEGEKNPENISSDAAKTKEMLQNEKHATAQAVPEPEKTAKNILRISYSKEAIDLSEKDKSALLPLVRMLKSSRTNRIAIKAYTSERDLGIDVRKVGLMRIISIREFLMKQGVDFSQTDVKILDTNQNKEDIDYIDIDKI